jgi:hypothetical protein
MLQPTKNLTVKFDVLIVLMFHIITNSGHKWKNRQYKTKKVVNVLCKN